MTDSGIAKSRGLSFTAAALGLVSVAIIGFSLTFIKPPTQLHSGVSVFSSPTRIDRYESFMTHPLVIVAEIVWLCFVFAKDLRGWRLVLFAALLGAFLGQLIHKLLTF